MFLIRMRRSSLAGEGTGYIPEIKLCRFRGGYFTVRLMRYFNDWKEG